MNNRNQMLLITGVVLDTAGAGLLAFSIIRGGEFLWFGVALMAVGSLLIVTWSRRAFAREQEATGTSGEQALEGWTPEPELAAPPPRPVTLRPMGRWRVVLWVAALGVALIYTGALPRRASPSQQLLAEYGESATATVHRKETRSRADGETMYYVSYNFTDRDGNGVRASRAVDPELYKSLEEGDQLEIVYFIGDPFTHRVEEIDEAANRPRREGVVALILLAIGFVAQDFQRRRHKRLTAYGAAAPGIVKELKRWGAGVSYTVQCEIHGRNKTLKGSERGTTMKRGDVLTVLYLPGQPQQALLYRQSLYQARN